MEELAKDNTGPGQDTLRDTIYMYEGWPTVEVNTPYYVTFGTQRRSYS